MSGHFRHGHAIRGKLTATYKSWMMMKQRCLNPRNKNFPDYGARGIAVCNKWLKFENFLADMGVAPLGMTLEREDNEIGYEPGNCRWANRVDQARNRRGARRVCLNGLCLSIPEWAERLGCKPMTLYMRMYAGWPAEEILRPGDRRKS